jgi:hypothetical protein
MSNLPGRLRRRRPLDQRRRQHRPRTALPPHLPSRMRRRFPTRQLQPLPHVQKELPASRLLPQKRHKRYGPPRTHNASEPRTRHRQRESTLRRPSRRPGSIPGPPTTTSNISSTRLFRPAHRPPNHLRSSNNQHQRPTNGRPVIVDTPTTLSNRRTSPTSTRTTRRRQ